MKTLLDPMFTFGLSAGLTVAMETIAKSIPSLATDIQSKLFTKHNILSYGFALLAYLCVYVCIDGLMRMLALILLQQPLRHPGAPKSSNQGIQCFFAFSHVTTM